MKGAPRMAGVASRLIKPKRDHGAATRTALREPCACTRRHGIYDREDGAVAEMAAPSPVDKTARTTLPAKVRAG